METEIRGFAAYERRGALAPYRTTLGPPGPEEVEIDVACCALCHSDLHLVDDDWGISRFPLVPGHEIVGTIRRLGSAVRDPTFAIGTRVGIGWQSGACFACAACRAGNEHLCTGGKQRTCVGRPGGLADVVRADARFCFPIPEKLADHEAAPLLCAGATVFSPLSRLVDRAGRRVGVIGLGGLGHLAVQFAAAMGSEVTAFDPDASKAPEAATLGAKRFCATDAASREALVGSFDLLLTCTHAALEWDAWMRLLDLHGTLCLTGIPPSRVELDPSHLLDGQKSLTGSVIASPRTMRATLAFAAEHGVRPWTERFPMEDADRALSRLRRGEARYRIVLERSLKPLRASRTRSPRARRPSRG